MSSDLWSFSVETYSRRGVEPACLLLQSNGANVCLLLCGLWLGKRGVSCDEQRLQRLRDVAGPWDAEVVQPVRALRQRWKVAAGEDAGLNNLREEVKNLEMEAERVLLVRLEQSAQDWPQDEARDLSAWLDGVVAGVALPDRDALHQLRVAVSGT
ncbi:hypothetical protein PS918_05056 [Pseudomonas fluorescens]|uniref:TIGR02444 family protein n=1 Tax=Pseudomonas fluorescens TaxID=294 RepID=A0A5E7UEV1_PSEFL|nr:TIGR02444 family protein [Pseudomonas fluorescens]VVQ09210.1 hypothetical protein PS918_05056 [Pseudomonas fluorescens]